MLLRVLAGFLGLAFTGGAIWLMTATSKTHEEPPAATQFVSGASITETFQAGERRIIYRPPGQDSSRMDCAVSPGTATIDEYHGGRKSDRNKYRAGWRAERTVRAQEAGTYTVTCSGQRGDVYRLGEPLPPRSPLVGILFLLGGFATSLLIIAVLIRRAKRRGQSWG